MTHQYTEGEQDVKSTVAAMKELVPTIEQEFQQSRIHLEKDCGLLALHLRKTSGQTATPLSGEVSDF